MTTLRFGLVSLLLAAPSFAASIYNVSINASSLPAGTSGFIDFGFNGGYAATAVVDNFTNAGGTLNAGSITTQGTVSGTLPGAVTIADNNAFYDEGLTFGSTINFRLTLSGTPSGSTGNIFTLSFFNSSMTGGLLTGNVNDFWIAQFQMNTLGNVTPAVFGNPSGGPSFATVSTPGTVPEPATGGMLLAGLAGAWVVARLRAMRRARSAPGM